MTAITLNCVNKIKQVSIGFASARVFAGAPLFSLTLLFALVLTGCNRSGSVENDTGDGAQHAETDAPEFERGPHSGRVLRDGDFAVEITIFERGVPPEFRVYVTQNGKAVAPATVAMDIQLSRFAGVFDRHRLIAKDDYLASAAEVYEPHSFDVVVSAAYQGRQHRWNYSSYEGRVAIDADMAKANGIVVSSVGPGEIREHLSLYGVIQADATRVRDVMARYAGVVRSVDVAVGDTVRAGQTLARIESNESLQTYSITAPIAGIVVRRQINPGETTGSEPLLQIADYSQVWAQLNVFPRDRARIRVGMPVSLRSADGGARVDGTVAAIGADAALPTALNARVVLDNRDQRWVPGQLVNADIAVASARVPVIVPLTALQTFRDWDVVFLNSGDSYQAQPVELGRRDGDNVEITGGLQPGMQVVVGNSYLLKADIEKSGASHDH